MFSYIAICWNHLDENISAYASSMSSLLSEKKSNQNFINIYNRDGLSIFTGERDSDSVIYENKFGPPGSNQSAIFLGQPISCKSFELINQNNISDISDSLSSIFNSPEKISSLFWGKFLFFLHDSHKNSTFAYREPTGSLPCYAISTNGIHILFSCLSLVEKLITNTLHINKRYVECIIKYNSANGSETGISEIKKILPGQTIKVTPSGLSSNFAWTPRDFIDRYSALSVNDAAIHIRETAQKCVIPLISPYKRIVHKLSGGIDSNIVLSMLIEHKNNVDILGYTYRFPDMPSDEYHLSSDCARHFGVKLLDKNLFGSDFEVLNNIYIPKTAEYRYNPGTLKLREIDSIIYNSTNSDAIFSGNGGDEVFFQVPTDLIFADYIYHNGLTGDFISKCLDASRLSRNSFYNVFFKSIRSALFKKNLKTFYSASKKDNTSFWNENSVDIIAETQFHPWCLDIEGVPPAKWYHISSVSSALANYTAPASYWGTNEVSPLYSQPLIELLLSIPTYALSWQGRDRGLARLAFHQKLPPKVCWRESKATGSTFYRDAVWEYREQYKKLLSNGALENLGFINKNSVDAVLNGNTINNTEISSLLHIAGLELWIRNFV